MKKTTIQQFAQQRKKYESVRQFTRTKILSVLMLLPAVNRKPIEGRTHRAHSQFCHSIYVKCREMNVCRSHTRSDAQISVMFLSLTLWRYFFFTVVAVVVPSFLQRWFFFSVVCCTQFPKFMWIFFRLFLFSFCIRHWNSFRLFNALKLLCNVHHFHPEYCCWIWRQWSCSNALHHNKQTKNRHQQLLINRKRGHWVNTSNFTKNYMKFQCLINVYWLSY